MQQGKYMIGHHYTSEIIYEQYIKHLGLNADSTFETILGTLRGTWLFVNALTELSVLGTCILQGARKKTTRICHLQVKYEIEDLHPLLRTNTDKDYIRIRHDGSLEGWFYHKNEPAVVVSTTIPPKRIQMVRCYDLMDTIK